MAKKSVNIQDSKLHPLFDVPADATDIVYAEQGISSDDGSMNDALDSELDNQVIPVPEGLRVVSQTIRETKSGGEVVDVVLEVDDIPGVTQYDLRVTPLDA